MYVKLISRVKGLLTMFCTKQYSTQVVWKMFVYYTLSQVDFPAVRASSFVYYLPTVILHTVQ